jgi:DNA polymerase-1
MGFLDNLRAQFPNLPERKIKWMAKGKAIELTERFFARMPSVRAFIEETHRVAADYKYIETWLGRRRWLRHIADRDFLLAHQRDAEELALYKNRDPSQALCWCDTCKESRDGERQATNTPVQGTAADIVQKFLNQAHTDPDLSEVDLVLQVHDEAGWEVPKEIVHDAIPRLQWHMQNPGIDDLRVPLRAGLEAADNWLEAK